MHARSHTLLFAVFFHFLLLSIVQAATPTTLRQTQLWTDGTGWTISGSAITSSDLETSPTGNVLVWQAHDIDQKWVNIDMDGIAGSDWTDFDTVELVLESELATGAQINLQIGSTGPNSGGDYYQYSIFVNWIGKKIFRLNLFDDFVKYRSPDGLSSITGGMISSSGWGANPVAGTVIRIHKIELKNTLSGRELRDFGSHWKFNNRELTAADYVQINGKAAMAWDTSSTSDKWLKIYPDEPNWEDLSVYDTMDLLIHSDVATNAQINLNLTSENPATTGGDYYLYSFNVDWVGTKLIRIALPNGFSVTRSPLGFSNITQMMICNDGWGATPTADTSLTIQSLILRKATDIAAAGVMISPITPVDTSITAPMQELVNQNGMAVWDAPNFNRTSFSGVAFHINHVEAQTSRIHFRYKTGNVQTDGLPAWLDVRLYDSNDHCIAAMDLQQDTPASWHEGWIDTIGLPDGRYRLVTSGMHDGFVVATDTPTTIGVNGGYMLGFYDDQATDYYVYIPNNVTDWILRASSPYSGQSLEVFNHNNQSEGILAAVQSSLSLSSLSFNNVMGDHVWRIHHSGGEKFRLYTYGIPGVIWNNQADALADQGSIITVGNRQVSHGWQATMAQWLDDRIVSDFNMTTPTTPTMPDLNTIDDATMIQNVSAHGLYGFITQGEEALPGQIFDTNSVWLGMLTEADMSTITPNPDGYNSNLIRKAYSLAWLYAYDAGGLNPYVSDPGLKNRVIAAAIQCWLMIGEKEIIQCEAETATVIDANAFAYFPDYIEIFSLIEADLPANLRAAFLDALTALAHRYQHYDSYANNQWMHILLGLEAAGTYAADPLFVTAYDRHLTACLNNLTTNHSMGQSPAGYYKENGGIDGNYNAMNEFMLGLQYRKTGNQAIWDSLQKSFELRRHLLFINKENKLNTPYNWNHRQSASLVGGYPSNRLMADLPEAAAILTRYIPETSYYFNTWNCIDPTLARNTVTHWWNHPVGDGISTGRTGGKLSGDLAFYAPPVHPSPPIMGCQETAPYFKNFNDEFNVSRFNDWYAITYNGNVTPANSQTGNGLALLWHEDLGPLILGDTEKYHALAGNTDDEALMLVSADAVTISSQRYLTKFQACHLTSNATAQTMTTSTDLSSTLNVSRTMTFANNTVNSNATITGGTWNEHALYLPLASSDNVTLKAYNGNGTSLPLAEGSSILTVLRFEWQWVNPNDANDIKTVEMTFDGGSFLCEVRHTDEPIGSNKITTVKIMPNTWNSNSQRLDWTVTQTSP